MIPEKIRSQSTALIHDLIMVPSAWFFAFWLRHNLGSFNFTLQEQFLQPLLFIIPTQLLTFYLIGLYRGIWRFASLPDLMRILNAVIIGTAISMLILFAFTRLEGIPRSVPVLYTILLVMFLSGPRMLYRWSKDQHLSLKSQGQRVLIVGAGEAGEMLVRDLKRKHRERYTPVAFVDDHARRQGRDIHGIPVLGTVDDIVQLCDEKLIDLIMLAIPSASSRQLRRAVEQCEKSDLPFRSVPRLKDLISGKIKVNELREVSIEDLLGRNPVMLDWENIRNNLSNRTLMVTGGGGSIGSELCRQLAKLNPGKLLVFDSCEYNLYIIEKELRQKFPELALHFYLGDVTDQPFVEQVMQQQQPKVVFHAAAYKHVPLLEHQIRQAIRNNVLGTRTVALAADRAGCEEFVLVSTDKAVNPANVMGATKRAAEIFCQNLNSRSKTCYITVRFGNVLGSAGSVIPLFREQIAQGGPITVTHPDMERYFMTIPEASRLIMQTTVLGKGGEIFVLDMGEAIKISYLAEQMIRLSGKIPDEDIAIEYVGLRPGEKLFEELFHEKEPLEPTQHAKVFLARHRQVEWSKLQGVMSQIEQACQAMDESTLTHLLHELVPEHGAQKEKASTTGADIVYLNSSKTS
jgi:FlaA1/EpsC-like NDP-sugar epimerase